ncbi:MAG: hypothetical protein COV73_03825 [Candidatus Omnitrophica bacterium CG11_big_fil_rev_8_21_14_0_20_43_6]|nr:MAG: hypothetical protein COV73_03825 [Candidatus Omnitrophica bacterium CG11_big_fil_rev_8_21_14_0_20_43_6]
MFSNNFICKGSSIILFLALFLYGCAALTVKRDDSMSVREYSYSYDEVWNNLIEVIVQKGDTITLKNKEKGIILTGYDRMTMQELKRIAKMPPLEISSGLAGAWLYARDKVDYSVSRTAPRNTHIKMTVYFQCYNASGQRWINIFTNGIKEKEIFDELELRLGQT